MAHTRRIIPRRSAVTDPPDRYRFTDGPPRRLSFAEVDQAVTALADRLKAFGLPLDSVVGLQLGNTVEFVVALLGIMRAGLIPAPLPLLWRRAETVEALGRIGARGLVTCHRIGTVDHGELATHIAADLFSIRFVGAFGRDLPDGVVPLDDIFIAQPDPASLQRRNGDPADHIAVVTFETTANGIMPVARSHAQLLAGGLAAALEGRIRPDAGILGTVALSSFAGLATTFVLWLITGGTLSLHHPFDADWLTTQCESDGCEVIVLPGPLLGRIANAGLLSGQHEPKAIAVWRNPERIVANARAGFGDVIDVHAFGEIGIVPIRRKAGGTPSPLVEGAIRLPTEQYEALPLVEVARIADTLALGGAMVPRHAFPLGSDFGPVPSGTGFVDTGYVCRTDAEGNLILDGPPAGLVAIGGYRFVLKDLQEIVGAAGEVGTLAVLPDTLAGYRLAGIANDRDAVRHALAAAGTNALVETAFSERQGDRASAA